MKIKLFILLILALFLFIIGCAINEIKKIASNPDFHPEWDVDVENIPILEGFSPEISDKIKDVTINSHDVSISPITNWPVNLANQALEGAGAVDVSGIVEMDIDGKNTPDDFIITGIYSNNARLVLKVYLDTFPTNSGAPYIDIDPNQINLTPIRIEGENYNFTYVSKDADNVLTYIAYNFLSGSNNYINFESDGNGNDISISNFKVSLDNNPAVPSYIGNCELFFKVQFDVGLNNGVVGYMKNTAELESKNNVSFAIDNPLVDKITDFNLKYVIESGLSFPLDIITSFTADSPPIPDTDYGLIKNASLLPRDNYFYPNEIVESKNDIVLEGNINDYNNLKMNVILRTIADPKRILILPTDTINLDIYIAGTVTVGF